MCFKSIFLSLLLLTSLTSSCAEISYGKQEEDDATAQTSPRPSHTGEILKEFHCWSHLPYELKEKIVSMAFSQKDFPPFDASKAGDAIQLNHKNLQLSLPNATNSSRIAFHPFRQEIAVVADEHTIIWNTITKQVVRDISQGGLTAIYSPDGKQLAIGGNHISIWNASNGNRLDTINGPAAHLAYSPNSKVLAISSLQAIRIVKMAEKENASQVIATITNEPKNGFFTSLSFGPNSNIFSAGTNTGMRFTWNLLSSENSSSASAEIPKIDSLVESRILAYSPDGMHVAYTTSKCMDTLSILPLKDESDTISDQSATETIIPKRWSDTTCLTFSPNGKNIIAGCRDFYSNSTVAYWDSKNDTFTKSDRELGHRFSYPPSKDPNFKRKHAVVSAEFSPSGEQVAILYRNKHCLIWGKKIYDYLINFKPTKTSFQFVDKKTGEQYTKQLDPLKARLLTIKLASAMAEKKQISITREEIAYYHSLPIHIRSTLQDGKKPAKISNPIAIVQTNFNAVLAGLRRAISTTPATAKQTKTKHHKTPRSGGAGAADADDLP